MPLLLDEALDRYFAFLKVERNLAKNSLDAYGRDLRQLSEYLSRQEIVDIEAIQPSHLAGFLMERTKAEVSSRSRARPRASVPTP